MSTVLEPQPLEDGYVKRCGIPALKLFLSNSALITIVGALIAIINYIADTYLLLSTGFLLIGYVGLFALSVCFLAEHKRSSFDFFTKDSLKFCSKLLLHTQLFKVYIVLFVAAAIGSWIVKFVAGDASSVTDDTDTSYWKDIAFTIIALSMLLAAFIMLIVSYVVYVFRFFVVLQYNLADKFFEQSANIDDEVNLTRAVWVSLYEIKQNRIATIKSAAVLVLTLILAAGLISFENKVLSGIVYSTIFQICMIAFTLYTYQLHREILLGKRKVKQEETETNIDAVPEAS